MARGAQQQATNTYNQANGVFGNSNQNAQNLYSQLLPQLQQEVNDPQGFGKAGLAAMNTANQQSIGGATAGAVGDAGLTAARTRNAGGASAAEDEAVRSGQRQLSQNATNIQGENAQLQQAQKQAGLQGLSGLYGKNTSDALSALGLENQSTNALTNAQGQGWFQQMLALRNAMNQGGGGGGGGATFGG